MSNMKQILLNTLSNELNLKIKHSNIDKLDLENKKIVIEQLGFEYFSNFSKEFSVDFSNLDMNAKTYDIDPKLKQFVIEHRIILFSNRITKERYLGVENFNISPKILSYFHFDKLAFCSTELISEYLDYIIMDETKAYDKIAINLITFRFPRIFPNTKPLKDFKKKFKKNEIILYFSNLFSYIIIKNKSYNINISSSYFERDIKNLVEYIKYYTTDEDTIVYINAMNYKDFNDIIEEFSIHIQFDNIKIIDFEEYKLLYNKLPTYKYIYYKKS